MAVTSLNWKHVSDALDVAFGMSGCKFFSGRATLGWGGNGWSLEVKVVRKRFGRSASNVKVNWGLESEAED